MKKTVVAVLAVLLIGGVFGVSYSRQSEYQHDLAAKLLVAETELSETRSTLLGYTRFTDYLSESKKAIEGQTKFLAAKVDREYTQVEHIQKSNLGLHSDATIVLRYAVEYSFGYDLKPDNFSVSGDKNGITVALGRPELVASPAVKIVSHEIPSKGVFVDEKEAVIALQQQLHAVAKNRGKEVQKEDAVVALCEKRLGEFLHDFLAKQPNVAAVPAIKFVYN